MKLSNLYATLFCLLVASATVKSAITDWTQPQTSLNDNKCIEQIKKLKPVWTGNCEGSYAAMVASVIQDNICIAFDNKSITDANLKKFVTMKVSYADVICNCEICQQFSGKGCNGGSVKDTLEFLKNEGFVGGSSKDNTSGIDITGDVWATTFSWKYVNCLGFFKNYCEYGDTSETKCNDTNNPTFDRTQHCGNKPTTGTDLLCPNKTDKKIKDVKQQKIFTAYTPKNGMSLIKAALDKGVLVSTMEIYSDIFFMTKTNNGVYYPMTGGSIGHFAVKIVGYVEVSGQAYWKVMLPFDL